MKYYKATVNAPKEAAHGQVVANTKSSRRYAGMGLEEFKRELAENPVCVFPIVVEEIVEKGSGGAKMQIKIETLERLIAEAKLKAATDSSLSKTLVLELVKECDTHEGDDLVKFTLKSSYQECDGATLGGFSFKVV